MTKKITLCNYRSILAVFFLFSSFCFGQEVVIDTLAQKNDDLFILLQKTQQNILLDSLKKIELQDQLSLVKENEKFKREKLLKELEKVELKETESKAKSRAKIEVMKQTEKGYPVILLQDTLFTIYTKVGALKAKDRAGTISEKIYKLYEDDFFQPDSLKFVNWENSLDIKYQEMILMSINDLDALWFDQTKQDLATQYINTIKQTVLKQQEENSFTKLLTRMGLVCLVVAIICFLIWSIHRIALNIKARVTLKKDIFKKLKYKDYVILTAEQELKVLYAIIQTFKWFFILLFLYLLLPLVFSIFPFTQNWAAHLFELIWTPFKAMFIAVWKFLPNLFTLFMIYIVMHYVILFVKYIFGEIQTGKLEFSGFHTDWAMPTFNIIKLLLYAFMFILMFPYLPGSDSSVFKGVSVFIGLIFSLGSSSAISNMVAGMVITYMRPFQIGDQIQIGDMVGVVIEKNMLVTRLKTTKNEEITIPNSTVLSGNTTNYSVYTKEDGLIIYTTADVGYEVPWREAEAALLEAADRTKLVLKNPKPFIAQNNLDDFYATYEINIYIKEAVKKAGILSDLRNNIQDVFTERSIELVSPHFRINKNDDFPPVGPQPNSDEKKDNTPIKEQ